MFETFAIISKSGTMRPPSHAARPTSGMRRYASPAPVELPAIAVHPAGAISATLGKEVEEIDSELASAISIWMKKHGKIAKPKLSSEMRQQLEECFELMDTDGSGAVDVDELDAAFKVRRQVCWI